MYRLHWSDISPSLCRCNRHMLKFGIHTTFSGEANKKVKKTFVWVFFLVV